MSTGVHHGSLVKRQLLYQLSYVGAPHIVFGKSSAPCRPNHGRPPVVVVKLLSKPVSLRGVERSSVRSMVTRRGVRPARK